MKRSVRIRAPRSLARLAVAAAGAGAVLAGLLTAAAPQEAQAAGSVPSWVIPLHFEDQATGVRRSCTGVAVTRSRVLATPDCFTGMSKQDLEFIYDPSTGQVISGGNDPRYRNHPRYDSATRRADWSVFIRQTPSSYGKAVLASSADAALYDAGSAATFYSWSGLNVEDAPRTRHSEPVVVRPASECASLLGSTLPWGTFCTTPAPGAPPVADEDQCLGDAGGALVAGGRLVGLSTTRSTGCVQSGVRLYTSVAAYRAQMTGFSREVDTWTGDLGSVLARKTISSSGGAMIDVCAIGQDGKLYGCRADNGGAASDWGYTFSTQFGDLKGDGEGDWLVKTSGGTAYRVVNPLDAWVEDAPRQWLGSGWDKYKNLVATRDLSGDGLPDILARDTYGVVWLYKGKSDGSVSGRTKITTWKYYTAIAGRGDYSGDGKNDVVARDSAGVLWLYRGNGHGGFEARTQVGSGWNKFNVIVGSGDMDHDGRQDLVVRTTEGAAYLFNADHAGGFYTKKLLASSGWQYFSKIA
ncbi:VCBS repeat-containing protein [Streptomyces sp. NPDC051940]|uniref:FG-GAP repeat domain-containing protein n=1 Tax=Streptomyces sp. NPDC051940 TaxID=3155675 RepID=UPI003418AF82